MGAVIGWFTNYLAVKMLFHPAKPVDLWLFKIQGIFPKNQKRVAQKIGHVVAMELLSVEDLKARVLTDDTLDMLNDKVRIKIDHFLEHTMPKKFKLMSLVMRQSMKDTIRDELLIEVKKQLPSMLEDYINHFESQIDIEAMIEEKFNELSSDRLEKIMYEILSKEFKFIEYVGFAIGLFVGLMQMGLVLTGWFQ